VAFQAVTSGLVTKAPGALAGKRVNKRVSRRVSVIKRGIKRVGECVCKRAGYQSACGELSAAAV